MNKAFVVCLLLILVLPSVNGWGPSMHGAFDRELLNNPANQDEAIIQIAKANSDYFYGCTMIPDSGVFYYFIEGGTKYKALHNAIFANCVLAEARTDQQLACAYGVVAHHVSDSISHNYYIPKMIESVKLPNGVVHAPSELLIDTDYVKSNPQDLENIRKGMDVVAADEEFMDTMQSCILSSQGVTFDLDENFARLRSSITTGESFFTSSFKVPDYYQALATGNTVGGFITLLFGGGLIFLFFLAQKREKAPFFKWVYMVIGIILLIVATILLTGGLSTYVSSAIADEEVKLTIDTMSSKFQTSGWQSRNDLDPTGWDVLTEKSQGVQGQTVVWSVLFFGLIGALIGLFILRLFVWFRNR